MTHWNDTLTRREVEVLLEIAQGTSSKDVAAKLFISKRTVDFHLQNIYAKLDVNNRFAAYHEALRLGLITLPEGIVPRP